MATVSEALAIGRGHHLAGRWREAEQIYRQILDANPEQAEAWFLLGALAHQTKNPGLAITYTGKAVALRPDFAEAHSNLGLAFHAQGNLERAVACYRRSLELKPNDAVACSNLGNALKDQRRVEEAEASYRRAVELKPDFAEAHNNLGSVLHDSYRRALESKPEGKQSQHHPPQQGNLDEAVACFGRALDLRPDYPVAHSNLGSALRDQGSMVEAVAHFRRAIELKPDYVGAHSNLVYALYFCPGYDAAAIAEEHRRWDHRHAVPVAHSIQRHDNDPSLGRRLRIGYISPNFRVHVLAFFFAPLFSAHDHQEFQIFCYSDVFHPDAVTQRLRTCADVWRTVAGLPDEQVAALVRQDQIDILVDLTMHMGRNRLLVLARKPAPVQVSWMAYPGTTGLAAIDYRLTDPYLDPPGLFDRYYSEQSVRLPDSFWCYDPLTPDPAVNSLPAVEAGQITFGSLNNFSKVNASVLQLWARVLRAVDQSRLLLLAPEESQRRFVLDVFQQEGIAHQRVSFADWQPRPQYLELYHRIDICLDTLPYNGHATSLDAYWMGVPVVTLVGPTVVGRAGLSQLTNLGLTELIAETPEQFVRIAADLAGDLARLSQLRATLRNRLKRSPLMDAPHFARNVEAAYRAMWQRWCATRKT